MPDYIICTVENDTPTSYWSGDGFNSDINLAEYYQNTNIEVMRAFKGSLQEEYSSQDLQIAEATRSLFVLSGISGDWFVSSLRGDDSNDGKSFEFPKATIASIQAVLQSNETVVLEDDSFWREEIQIQSLANNTIRRSGTGSERPILDASDVATGWTLSSGQSSTYELSWIPESGNGVTDARITAYEDGDLLIYRDSISEVELNPGSYTVDGFADTAGNIVYIHPSDSGDPNNNGSTYEVTKRRNCIWCGPGTTVDGVHLRRNINNNG
ncbi:MAG: hypothetical protein AAF959_07590, partial [Cyanobacteria bacterium P01_D01_bin.56]